jgi:hypothetical protein
MQEILKKRNRKKTIKVEYEHGLAELEAVLGIVMHLVMFDLNRDPKTVGSPDPARIRFMMRGDLDQTPAYL